MNTVTLILAIVALGISIAALVVALKKNSIESQSNSDCNSNEVQSEANQALNEGQASNVSITSNDYPFTYINGTFKMDGNLEVTGGITCLK